MKVNVGDYVTLKSINKVVRAKENSFLLTLTLLVDTEFWFDNKCIKDVYKVTKIS
jgi:hypothetical protein